MLDDERKSPGWQNIDDLRRKSVKEMDSYFTKVVQNIESDTSIGDSIVRNFYVFDDLRFALEQRMTLTVAPSADEEDWTGEQIPPSGRLQQGSKA